MKNPVVRILVAVLAGLLLAGASRPADGSVLKRKRSSSKRRKPPRKKRVRQRMPSDRVAPSGEIEAVVAGEVRRGTFILAHLAPDNLFESSYVVSAIFYHDGFLESFASDREDADPGRRIVARLVLVLTPEHKALYVHLLHGLWDEWGFVDRAPGLALPVAESEPGRRRRRSTHKHALDLFVAEGTRVRTATDGIAVLAEGGWTAGDPFSTSSRRGGNSVVVFDPWQDRFYRYCHLESVVVESGAMLEAGEAIGTVGHTGLNASRPGHGRHLHFEVNEYDG
ncbi:MAG: M23 family metallopeptidase, partial [Acidobacteria bacterium]|nr:M23 family metallopeptidase [Acidobacteriota bacterium]